MSSDVEAAISERLRDTERTQMSAADPTASAWVSANAGTGKTHVLTLRVLRLLLAGTSPERILCLTYTKAAAAVMSKRIFEQLGDWATGADEDVVASLRKVLGRAPEPSEIARARTLFTLAIETPGGLKVQTIHAFAERLLQRFPLEAGIPPAFEILAEDMSRELKAHAIERTLSEATSGQRPELEDALGKIVRFAADAQFDALIARAVDHRRWLIAASRFDPGSDADDFIAVGRYLKERFGVRTNVTVEMIEAECIQILPDAELKDLCAFLQTGSVNDRQAAADLAAALRQRDSSERARIRRDYFLLKSSDELRARLMTQALANARPALAQQISDSQARFLKLWMELKALTLIDASLALYEIAGNALQHYAESKLTRGALDFDDLIAKTMYLLSDRSAAQWALFKLDDGLDHILVDEAQDTNPDQWTIIEALAGEFFSDEGLGAKPRTVFAVGDAKQSIYSFQGAMPEMFRTLGARFRERAQAARRPWRDVSLTLSFRTVAPVLDAVDRVFSGDVRGVGNGTDAITHIAKRVGQAGLVEIWPAIAPDLAPPADPWDPLSDASEKSPANQLADRIAATIRGWLDGRQMLTSENRPIQPSDILILVRRRQPFAIPMIAALKRRGIAVAGSDRMALTEQIAVMDLMVLGDFLTLPEDDLALATVLKSPIFGLSDEQLLDIAPGRKNKSLWKALLDAAQDNMLLRPATETLKRWRARADFLPPFEFYSNVLDHDGTRTKFLERLGPEAADAIDEFLDIALRHDDSHPPSLTGFLSALRAAQRDVQRDMEHTRNEVRVMTVHGAKGLEAPIVFLPDTCTTRSAADQPLLKMPQFDRPSGIPEPVVWSSKGSTSVAPIATARAAGSAREAEERMRLLYVAMTRARDRLYIAGFDGKTKRPPDCWYDIVFSALKNEMQEVTLDNGQRGWRLEAGQTAQPEKSKAPPADVAPVVELPGFVKRQAAAEPRLAVPLAPSRLEAYAPDAEGEPLPEKRWPGSDAAPSPLADGADIRFLRGNLTHKLLQHLPSIAALERPRVAAAFVEARGASLTKRTRASIVFETLAILHSPEFGPLFGEGSMAEVPIAARLPRPAGRGPALDLSGQIDRLLVTEKTVRIIDYKTNRPPPQSLDGVADAYLYQLAAYSLALAKVYPDHNVEAALLWTDGPRIMNVPREILDSYAERLWHLDVTGLDAS